MGENENVSKIVFDIFEKLEVRERINLLHKLFDNDKLFLDSEIHIFDSFLSAVVDYRLQSVVDVFLNLLGDLENIDKEKEKLSEIIEKNIKLREKNVSDADYISTLKKSLQDFSSMVNTLINDKLENALTIQKINNKNEKMIQASTLANVLGIERSTITIQRGNGYFQNYKKIDGKVMIPYSDVDFYVRKNHRHYPTWNDYKDRQL